MYQHKLLTPLCEKQDLMLRDLVRSFVNDQIMPLRQQIDDDENHILVRQILQKLAALGFLKSIFPQKYGGGGGSLLSGSYEPRRRRACSWRFRNFRRA